MRIPYGPATDYRRSKGNHVSSEKNLHFLLQHQTKMVNDIRFMIVVNFGSKLDFGN